MKTFYSWLWALALIGLTGINTSIVSAQPAEYPDLVLETALDELEENSTSQATLGFQTQFAYAKLQLRKLTLLRATDKELASKAAQDFLQQGLDAIEHAKADELRLGVTGELTEMAYLTADDGSAQPYHLLVPSSYIPDKKTPLLVFLHGYVASTSILDPWTLDAASCKIAQDLGCILLIPYGRRNTDFQGVGERDVFAAIQQVQNLYSVDDERIYLTGVSMGGMGAWNLALRHPGFFAATAPIAGHTDMHTWWPRMLPGWPVSRDDIPPFRRFLVEWDNPLDLVVNARNQAIFCQHGAKDNLIPVTQSRSIVDAAKKYGIDIKYKEWPQDGHYIYWKPETYREAWSWLTQQCLDPSPKHVTYMTYSLEYPAAYWVTIRKFQQWGKPAKINCQVMDDGEEVKIRTENIATLALDIKQMPVENPGKLTFIINDEDVTEKLKTDGNYLVWNNPKSSSNAANKIVKRQGLCGPVEEVFDGPFMVVIGTGGTDDQYAENIENSVQWLDDWEAFSDGEPQARFDTDVNDEDIKKYNLVLFGIPQSNSVLAKFAEELPIKIGDHEYEVAGKTYKGPNLGLVMCYPNPLAPERYVAIYSGALYGKNCGINHKFDLIPDFIVFDSTVKNYDDTDQHEVAGYFDMNWQLAPELTWIREP